MDKEYLELITDEEFSLNRAKKELHSIKEKWFKLTNTLRKIEFLEFYIQEKEKLIENLNKWEKNMGGIKK